MTRREAMRQAHQADTLIGLGFSPADAEALRRISLTLRRWSEHECNGAIQRDGDQGDGDPYWYNVNTGRKIGRVPDRERGALKRLQTIIDERNDRALAGIARTDAAVIRLAATYYVQGDPRGCALYILPPGAVPAGADVDGYYSRGIAVY
jgi:hypothetical protein